MAAATPDAAETIRLAFAGRRERGGRLIYAYQDQEDRTRDLIYFNKPLRRDMQIGQEWTFHAERPAEGRLLVSGGEYAGRSVAADLASRWDAEDRAAMVAREQYRQARNEQASEIAEHVAALRRAMVGLNRTQRAAMIATLIEELR